MRKTIDFVLYLFGVCIVRVSMIDKMHEVMAENERLRKIVDAAKVRNASEHRARTTPMPRGINFN